MEASGRMWMLEALAGKLVPLVLLFCGAVLAQEVAALSESGDFRNSFVKVEGVQLRVSGRPFYVNGWNSYWLMAKAAERFYELQASRNPPLSPPLEHHFTADGGALEEVREVMASASALGMTVCRSWAFSDGGYHALQIRPGHYDPILFKALDFAVAEAKKHNVKLILCLGNDLPGFGGKAQYVRWAVESGHQLSIPSDDAFYVDATIKSYYKQHVKAVLTRKNTVTGVVYRDDPTILAWELINEPRCSFDPSGETLKAWTKEMAAYVKELDQNHLVTLGMEGFYSGVHGNRKNVNPDGGWAELLGTDFIEQNTITDIDFSSVHAYPDNWLPWLSVEGKLQFFNRWVDSHIEDAQQLLGKPVLFTEFALSDRFQPGSTEKVLESMFRKIYDSAKVGGAGAGSLLWQFKAHDMDRLVDQFSLSPRNFPTGQLFAAQSCRLQALYGTWQRLECPSETDTVE